MLYSALVMRHPKDGHPPIAVADLLTKMVLFLLFYTSSRHFDIMHNAIWQ